MKVTEKQITERITFQEYIRIPGTTVTICHLVLENGFSVRGESACVDPMEFNAEKGEKLAYKDAFNKVLQLEGYLLTEQRWRNNLPQTACMDFGQALEVLKNGHKVARTGWNGKGLWLELQRPDAFSKMTLPYIYINYPLDSKTTPGARVPWLASQTDLLSEDWIRV